MNTRRVNSAAGVIQAAQANDRTPAGIALALESAQLLTSPEMAAEVERLQARVVELESQLTALSAQSEVLRATHFGEAARLLEDTGRDDDAVNLLDTVAHGIRQQMPALAPREDPHDGPLHHDYRVPRDLPEMGDHR